VSDEVSARGRLSASGLERMLIFSDAVIAIAMTVLALDLPVPVADSPSGLLTALTGEAARAYFAFLLAFALIGVSWIGHHQLFSNVQEIDVRVVGLNFVVLLGFVLVPWGTEALAESPGGPGLAVFSAVLALLAGGNQMLGWYVDRAGFMTDEAAERMEAVHRRNLRIGVVLTAMFVISIPLALVAGDWIIVTWLVFYAGVGIYARRIRRVSQTEA
jgi:uncharacterized membrane protein